MRPTEPINTDVSGRGLLRNFIKFCVSFSLTHAAVNSVLAYSSTLLGAELGSIGGAVLYLVYSSSALLLSRSALSCFGPKWTVVFGVCSLQIYVLLFFGAVMIPAFKWPLFVAGAAVGGVGAGVLWVGQSLYYSLNASAYSEETVGDSTASISMFAAYFAFFYLFLEVLLQMLALSTSLLHLEERIWLSVVFGTGSAFIVVGSVMILSVRNFKPHLGHSSGGKESVNTFSLVRWSVMKRLLQSDNLFLLLPFQVCFGLSSGLINYYINSFVVAEHHGEGYVGLVMALDTLVSALAVFPLSLMSNQMNTACLITLGSSIYFFNGAMVLFLSTSELAQWGFLLPFFVSHGISRCIWEGANKALISEYYTSALDREVAFTTVYFSSGISAGISFICYFYISKFYFSLVILGFAVWSIACSLIFIWSGSRSAIEESRPSSGCLPTITKPLLEVEVEEKKGELEEQQ